MYTEKKRGVFLSIWLVWIGLSRFSFIGLAITGALTGLTAFFSLSGIWLFFASIFLGMFSLVDVLAALMIFNWKKGGVYLYYSSLFAGSIFLSLLIQKSFLPSLFLCGLTMLFIHFVFFAPKWKHFE